MFGAIKDTAAKEHHFKANMRAIFVVTIVTFLIAYCNASPVGECPSEDGEDVTLLPDESDCNIFYVCHRGVPHLLNCNPGLHFNNVERVCDWPEQAGCELSAESEDESEEESETESSEVTDIVLDDLAEEGEE